MCLRHYLDSAINRQFFREFFVYEIIKREKGK